MLSESSVAAALALSVKTMRASLRRKVRAFAPAQFYKTMEGIAAAFDDGTGFFTACHC